MELEDLAAHKSELVDPISYTYGGDLRVHEVDEISILPHGGLPNSVSSQWARHSCVARAWYSGGCPRKRDCQAFTGDGA
jgi:hypothetical protein